MERLDRDVARAFVDGLWARRKTLVDAIVADGWPESMARAGLDRHRMTWDVDALVDSLRIELAEIRAAERHQLVWPKRVHHIWPALPGAGITPVIVGMLLGIEQGVRPSRRGIHFGRRVAESAPWELIEPGGEWDEAELVVVSGSDETVLEVRRRMQGRGEVVGYGHRVSFAVVVDGTDVALDALASEVAADVVLWHQQGCFSVRSVLFCGTADRRREFCAALADAIATREQQWDADEPGADKLASRAQALGVAELSGEVFTDGIGYVRPVDGEFDGSREAIHSVTVHPVDGPESVEKIVDVGPTDLQGVAVGGDWRDDQEGWIEALGALGATRICGLGQLQQPPAGWWHDGRPNALSWARVVTVDERGDTS